MKQNFHCGGFMKWLQLFPLDWLYWSFLLLFFISSLCICEGSSLQADIVWGRMNDRSLAFLGRITLYLFKYLCPRGSWWAVPDCCSALQLLHNLHLNKKEFKREYFILGNEWSIQAWYKFVFNVKLIIVSYLSRPFLFFRISVGHSWGSHSGATFPPCFFRCAVVQTGEGNENTDLSWQMFQVIVSLQSFLHDE